MNPVKVLGINGSPRIGGNTDILLDKALEGARSKGADTEKIILNKLRFCPCQETDNITDDVNCVIQDDMQEVYRKIKGADVLILASPIFFGSLSAQTKMMIDRFQCAWKAKYVLKKDTGFKKIKGAFISVEGSERKDFFANAKAIVRNFFAVINVGYESELFCPGIDEKAGVLKHPECLKRAFDMGAMMVSC